MLPGDTLVSGVSAVCDCGYKFELEVLMSVAGYYVGTFCPNCGPNSRETGYFATREKALACLVEIKATGCSPFLRL